MIIINLLITFTNIIIIITTTSKCIVCCTLRVKRKESSVTAAPSSPFRCCCSLVVLSLRFTSLPFLALHFAHDTLSLVSPLLVVPIRVSRARELFTFLALTSSLFPEALFLRFLFFTAHHSVLFVLFLVFMDLFTMFLGPFMDFCLRFPLFLTLATFVVTQIHARLATNTCVVERNLLETRPPPKCVGREIERRIKIKSL